MAVNKGRLWTMVEAMVGEEQWKTKVGTLAGCIVTDPDDLRRFVEVMGSETRDVLVVATDAIYVAQPKQVKKLGLLSGLKSAFGDTSGLGSVVSFPKNTVRGFTISAGAPGRVRSSGSLFTATIDLDDDGRDKKVVFVADANVIDPGGIESNVADWRAAH